MPSCNFCFKPDPLPVLCPSGLPDSRTQTVEGQQALVTSDTSVHTPTIYRQIASGDEIHEL